jgi:hypothetical protein
MPEQVDLRVHDLVALDEIELYSEVLSAVAASDKPLTYEELDRVLGLPTHGVASTSLANTGAVSTSLANTGAVSTSAASTTEASTTGQNIAAANLSAPPSWVSEHHVGAVVGEP